jgi:hypothetical protein
VEASSGFRNWLSSFTEDANGNRDDGSRWQVPYGSGSYSEFSRLDFQELKMDYRLKLIEEMLDDPTSDGSPLMAQFIVDHLQTDWKNEFRFNVVTFSNFLTQPPQVNNLLNEIRSTAFALRNRGSIVVMGGRGAPYPEVYQTVRTGIETGRYEKKKTKSKCEEVTLKFPELSYSLADPCGKRLRDFYRFILDRFREFGVADSIPGDTFARFRKTIESETIKKAWAVHAFRKSTWLKKRKRSQK